MWRAFILFLTVLVQLIRAVCKSRDELVLENLALRQQVTALNLGKHKPKLHDADRAFWSRCAGHGRSGPAGWWS